MSRDDDSYDKNSKPDLFDTIMKCRKLRERLQAALRAAVQLPEPDEALLDLLGEQVALTREHEVLVRKRAATPDDYADFVDWLREELDNADSAMKRALTQKWLNWDQEMNRAADVLGVAVRSRAKVLARAEQFMAERVAEATWLCRDVPGEPGYRVYIDGRVETRWTKGDRSQPRDEWELGDVWREVAPRRSGGYASYVLKSGKQWRTTGLLRAAFGRYVFLAVRKVAPDKLEEFRAECAMEEGLRDLARSQVGAEEPVVGGAITRPEAPAEAPVEAQKIPTWVDYGMF
jgi:hypothetical protein